MPTTNNSYGSNAVVALDLSNLASSNADVGRESAIIDCVAIDALDLALGGIITVGSPSVSTGRLAIYLAASFDGAAFEGNLGGGDRAVTPGTTTTGGFQVPSNLTSLLKLVAMMPVASITANVRFPWTVPSLQKVYGWLPRAVSVFVTQNTGGALHATPTNHQLLYTPLNVSSV